MNPFYRYFLALVPPAWPRRLIGRVRGSIEFLGALVEDHRLHLTLAVLRESAAPDTTIARRLDAAFADAALGGCTVLLERLVLGGTAALVPLRRDCPVPRLQAAIAERLAAAALTPLRWPAAPHVTLGYAPRGSGRRPVDPIGWQADSIVLIESCVGRHVHRTRGRWPLVPPPSAPVQLGFGF